MSACRCGERARPFAIDLSPGSNERPRQWFVLRRNESYSAFNGYRHQWSDFSTIECRVCGGWWKTKAKWVSLLRDCDYYPESRAPRVEVISS